MPIPHMEYNDLKLPLSYSLVFQTFQQPTLTCRVSWQNASSAFLRLGSAASCAKTVALVDKLGLQSVPRDNTLIMRQRHKPQIPEHTHKHHHLLVLLQLGAAQIISYADLKLM